MKKAAAALLKMAHTTLCVRVQKIEMKALGPVRQAPHEKKRRTPAELLRDKLLAHRVRATGKKTLSTIPGLQSMSMLVKDLPREQVLQIIQLAQLDGKEAAEKWWFVFTDLNVAQRLQVNLDDICAASGVKPRDLIVAMLEAMLDNALPAHRLVAASFLPTVASTLGQSAQRLNSRIGERDRERLLIMHGSLPAKQKGTVVQVSANAQAAASAALDPSVPSFASDMEALSGMRAIPARATVVDE